MKKILIILCILILFLTACVSDQTTVENEEFNPETDFQSQYCDLTVEEHPIVETEDGYYMLIGYYLYYVDKETMEYTPLCNKPNCLHQKETDQTKVISCNAMVQTGNLFYLCLNYYEGHLYTAAIETVVDENGLPEKKYVMEKFPLDGGSREIIHEFEKPVEMAIVHRGYIYYSSAYAFLGSEAAGVYRVPVDGGEEELIYTAESNKNQISHLRIIGNALVFTEYYDDGASDLYKYDLSKKKVEKVFLGENLSVLCASTARGRIYYRVSNGEEIKTISTKLDGSDKKNEEFVAYHQDEDYYYVTNQEDYTQKVYDWETKEEVAEFSQLSGMGSFFAGGERLFWYCLNDKGGITLSYINQEDIPKGDKAVKVLMDFSSDETFPGIITVPN